MIESPTAFLVLTGNPDHHVVDNPDFVDTSVHDFHLESTSPAIDAGSTNSLSYDFDDNAVPYNSVVDIGAFEYGY